MKSTSPATETAVAKPDYSVAEPVSVKAPSVDGFPGVRCLTPATLLDQNHRPRYGAPARTDEEIDPGLRRGGGRDPVDRLRAGLSGPLLPGRLRLLHGY